MRWVSSRGVILWVVVKIEGDDAMARIQPLPCSCPGSGGNAAGWGHTEESDVDPTHHPCSPWAPGKSQGRPSHLTGGLLEAGVLLPAFRAWVRCGHVGRQAGLQEEGASVLHAGSKESGCCLSQQSGVHGGTAAPAHRPPAVGLGLAGLPGVVGGTRGPPGLEGISGPGSPGCLLGQGPRV